MCMKKDMLVKIDDILMFRTTVNGNRLFDDIKRSLTASRENLTYKNTNNRFYHEGHTTKNGFFFLQKESNAKKNSDPYKKHFLLEFSMIQGWNNFF